MTETGQLSETISASVPLEVYLTKPRLLDLSEKILNAEAFRNYDYSPHHTKRKHFHPHDEASFEHEVIVLAAELITKRRESNSVVTPAHSQIEPEHPPKSNPLHNTLISDEASLFPWSGFPEQIILPKCLLSWSRSPSWRRNR